MSNVAASCRAALERGADTLADRSSVLQNDLDGVLLQFDGVMEATTDLQAEVTDEVGEGG